VQQDNGMLEKWNIGGYLDILLTALLGYVIKGL
jgi:hypothetical protein